jgi:hypothetical protein
MRSSRSASARAPAGIASAAGPILASRGSTGRSFSTSRSVNGSDVRAGPAAPAAPSGIPRCGHRRADRRPAAVAPQHPKALACRSMHLHGEPRARTNTMGRANSACALIGTRSMASTIGPDHRPARGEGVGRGAGRGGHHHAIAPPRRQRPAVDLHRELQHALTRAFSTLASLSAQVRKSSCPPTKLTDVEGHPLLDGVVPVRGSARWSRCVLLSRTRRGTRHARG